MITVTLFGYFIIAAVVAIVSSLLGVLYEMQKSKVYWLKTNPEPPEQLNPCDHGFELKEVMDLKTDPKCAKCGKKLSEIKPISWTEKN